MAPHNETAGCRRTVATVGLVVAIVGILLVEVVPGDRWSDVPGWILVVAGVLTQIVFSAAYLFVEARHRS